jgi:hypothetical protein
VPTEPRRSTRVPQPSSGSIQSKEYLQREELGRQTNEEWTTNRRLHHAGLTLDHSSVSEEDYITCLVETKASHNIPRSYRHAMSTDPD